MKKTILIIFVLLISIKSFACSCECTGDCSFSAISDNQNFVALIKVIEYTDFLEDEIYGYDGKMPYSMTVEIVKKYKGSESKKRIKIWGDNGILCRPYISNFEVGKYYLIAPSIIENDSQTGKANDYDFFACWTDYLEVDYEKQIAYGKYSWWRKEISLEKFERKLEK
ncbi:hypothetical protein [Patiriisocius hiemis]|uniref:Uncharacterized protein n=1 Tax=Patiriisocius hiemis TaxID=3075604 RepID=A0ABU2YEK6_9FLAO|nr:hypothetical protein [Constantimarinum sp. W242]MDT0556215.1 hypothetical protein [Constantimarinum sp. W242]